MDLPSGTIVDRKYEILSPLAEGGMGSVYRARHVLTEELVALKVLTLGPSDVGQARRFKLEVSVAAKVKHPAIVKVFDAGLEPQTGRFYLAMELLEGRSLGAAMDEGEPQERVLRWLVEAVEAMVAAHGADVVHRDLKPDNLFVERSAAGEHIRLLDFGIARDLASPSITTTGVAIGTALYMAPEQATASKVIGPAADVWAFGAMLYEVLTGRRPFEGPNAHAVVIDAVTRPHVGIEELRPDLDAGWGELVDACLAKKPEHRPSTSELASALRTLVQGAQGIDAPIPLVRSRLADPPTREVELAATEAVESVARPSLQPEAESEPVDPLPTSRRTRVWLGLGALVAVGGALLFWGFAGASTPVEPPPDPAPMDVTDAPSEPELPPLGETPPPIDDAPPEPPPTPTALPDAPAPTRVRLRVEPPPPSPGPAAVEPEPAVVVAPIEPPAPAPLPLPTPAEPEPVGEGRGVLQGVDAFDRQSGRRR